MLYHPAFALCSLSHNSLREQYWAEAIAKAYNAAASVRRFTQSGQLSEDLADAAAISSMRVAQSLKYRAVRGMVVASSKVSAIAQIHHLLRRQSARPWRGFYNQRRHK